MIWNDRIKELRSQSKLTLLEVANALGITEATAQRYESKNGIKNIPYEQIIKLAKIFNVTPAYIMGWDENPVPIQVDYLAHKITNDEYTLIEMFRKLDDDSQRNISDMVKRMYTYAEMMKNFKDGGLK